ncbi:metal ABC transporter substrate-binding protein [Cellulomonas triticagri]|uniref:Zinc ABC transporter substrate-binding protein n=1 Tax=Cellulomonas triticagri TaxID=2483352 RepID=A0A3M2JLZ7_9CELL|nr:metal ABC transporter substrate-binding protein [Cellulomonas triticagri]RMI12613.1 zinc ABC transporter substrate-binding protein [Cellulomonas triticagri]
MARTTPRPPTRRTVAAAGLALAALAGAAACSPGDSAADGHEVVAAFYPLQYVAERIGGEHVSVSSLTPPGGESHDLELSPSAVAGLGDADLVVYLSGFQAATDAAVDSTSPAHVVDAAEVAALESGPDGVAPGSGSGALDPHFWLDPTRLADVGQQVADALTAIDPEHADEFAAAAADLAADLDALDTELADGLAACRGATLVASHEAFGYLAQRYGLHQVGLSGIDPEVEPSPARLRDVAATVRDEGVQTLYFEVLTSPKVTQTLADELGVATAVLDPIEGLAEGDDRDYLDIMRDNLDALTTGLTCSA